MTNTEIYEAARQNLLNKRQSIGYVRLVTDCWGHLAEYEKEWHKQKGGESSVDNLFPNYGSEQNMHAAMREAGLTVNSIAETLGWDALPKDADWEDGDLAIITPIIDGAMRFGVWFYYNGIWEVSAEEKDGMTTLKQDSEARHCKYHFRKRDLS